jgi:hypothetical protein
MKVDNFVYKKTKITKKEILNNFAKSKLGFDGSFVYKGFLLAVRRDLSEDTIIYLYTLNP